MSGDRSLDSKDTDGLKTQSREPDLQPEDAERIVSQDRVLKDTSKLASTESYRVDETVAPCSTRNERKIGPYVLVECLGEGGMGSVWEAKQEHPVRRRVALKLIKPGMGSKEILVRFEAERQALAMMDHPNIARIIDAGTSPDGQPYFAMEWVKGISLTRFCDANRLSIDQRLVLFCDICSGVQHAHQKGIVHRDLKPGNIVVTTIDKNPTPKVIDFGLAKAIHSADRLTEDTMNTVRGQVLGTLKYMSPEQASLGRIDIDTRTDVYALGVILYELLTGSTPLDDDSVGNQPVMMVLENIRERIPNRPSERLASCQELDLSTITAKRCTDANRLKRILVGDLDWIVMKALEKDRSRRYESAAGFAADIRRFLNHEPVVARPPTRRYRLQKFVRKNRAAVIAAGLILGTLVAGMMGTSWGLFVANRARDAEAERAEGERLATLQSEKRLTQIENSNGILAGIFRDLDIRKAKNSQEPIEAILASRLVDAGRQLESGIVGVPLSIAKMKDELGYSLLSLGYSKDAIRMFEFARKTREEKLGAVHPDTLTSINGLAEAYQHEGRTDDALVLFEKVLALRKTELGTDHPDTLVSMNNLAECFRESGNLDEAVPLMQETWNLRKKVLGLDHQDTLTTLNNLALVFHDDQMMDKALPLYERSFELTKQKFGTNHADTLTSMNNLAGGYFAIGRIDSALELLEQARDLNQTNLGQRHPDTLSSMSNLAEAYRAAGKLDKAIPLYENTIILMRDKLGEAHPDTQTTMNNLAAAYRVAGKLDDAISLYEETLELMTSLPEPGHPYLTHCIQGLATCLWTQGNVVKSIPYFEKALQIQRSELGSDSAETLSTIANLGVVYRDAERFDDAIVLLEEAVSMIPRYPSLVRVRRELRTAYLKAGRNSDFKVMLDADIRSSRSEFEVESLELATALTFIGLDLLSAEEYRQAETVLREGFQIRQSKLAGDWRTFNTESLLGESIVGRARLVQETTPGSDTITAQKLLTEAGPLLLEGYQGLTSQRESIPPIARGLRLSQAVDRLIDFAELTEDVEAAKKWVEEKERLLQGLETVQTGGER